MKVKKQMHNLYKEYQRAKKKSLYIPQMSGMWQYIYSSKKGEISLVKLLDYFREGEDFWEIYCLKGNLFEDVERFDTKKEAEIKIKKYL